MPEVVRALGYLLIVAGAVFFLAQKALVPSVLTRDAFAWRRNAWLVITILAYAAHNFWLFLVIAAVALLVARNRDSNRLALFFFLMFAVPQISGTISGLGILNKLFSIDYLIVASMVLLLPAWLVLIRQKDTLRFGSQGADWLMLAFLVLQCVLLMRVTTATDALRQGLFYPFFLSFLPYYVASRLPRTQKQLREAMVCFVIAAMLLAGVGCLEYLKSWLLYNPLRYTLAGADPWPWSYLPRGSSIRASASVGQAIPLGYVITIAIAFWLAVRTHVNTLWWRLGLALLCGGLLSTISRGPWVGAIAMAMVWAATGKNSLGNVAKFSAAAAVVLVAVLLSPVGDRFVDLIPFVGTAESQNAEYRRMFLIQSMIVIEKYPWFGLANYSLAPEYDELRSPWGLVDTLNIFFTMAIAYGLVGFGLFVALFIACLRGVMRRYKVDKNRDADTAPMGRGLIAAWFAIVVTINTISGITVIPIVYWFALGLCVAYANLTPDGPADEPSIHPGHSSAHGRKTNAPRTQFRNIATRRK